MAVALALASALAWGGAGCAVNPVTGDREMIFMSTADERKVSEEGARAVEGQIGLVEDEALAAYVDALGQRLAKHAPRQDVRYQFHVVAMDEPNAFALPGGHIYVSRGLLLLSNSEAELAGVLGHEIGHVEARHAAQRDALQKTLQVMAILGAVGMAVGGPSGTGAPGPIGQPGYFAYSRDQESQADRIGMELAVAAGFDPGGIADFLASLERHHRLKRGYSRETAYFDSHPATAERAAAAATEAEVLDVETRFALRGTRAAYLELLDGLSVGTPASEGVVVGRQFMHADLGITVLFPPGYEVHNSRSAVVGFSRNGKALVALEMEGPGDDVLAAARGYAERTGAKLDDLAPIRAGELEGVRAETSLPGVPGGAVITWVHHEGLVYRLTALSRGVDAPEPMALAGRFARSFRTLTDEERDGIEAPELAVIEAVAGETLGDLARRTGNEWDENETAVQNGLVVGERLAEGQLVKIALQVPYRPGDTGRARVEIPAQEVTGEEGEPDPATSPGDFAPLVD